MSHSARRSATLDDFWAIPESERFHELVAGELVPKAAPSGEHGDAQAGVIGAIRPGFQRRARTGGPGGWWTASEVEVLLATGDVVRPDVLGWRRDHCPERPTGTPVRKLRLYQHVAIPHYWIADPRDSTLFELRWSAAGYVTRLRAERGETVRAEPFEAIELVVGTLFGDDAPEFE